MKAHGHARATPALARNQALAANGSEPLAHVSQTIPAPPGPCLAIGDWVLIWLETFAVISDDEFEIPRLN